MRLPIQGNVAMSAMRVLIAHDPGPFRELAFEHAAAGASIRHIALARTFVLVVLARKFVEEPDLAEHRTDSAHLKHQPLDGLISAGRIARHELAGLFGEIDQDRAGLEQGQRFPARPFGIQDGRDFAVGVERQKLRRHLILGFEADEVRFIRQTGLFQHDRDLDAVGGRQRIELHPVGMPRGPFSGDWERGKIVHVDSSSLSGLSYAEGTGRRGFAVRRALAAATC